jgi:hypothetical protein
MIHVTCSRHIPDLPAAHHLFNMIVAIQPRFCKYASTLLSPGAGCTYINSRFASCQKMPDNKLTLTKSFVKICCWNRRTNQLEGRLFDAQRILEKGIDYA